MSKRKHESAFVIPHDWEIGDDMRCIRLMWPSSNEWSRLLVSLLYLLTRGREWDKESGTITEVQRIAWAIWDANVPLRACGDSGDGSAIAPPGTIEYRGGSLIVIGEDEMGQVVTDVTYDAATGELIIWFGKCCSTRITLAGADAGVVVYGEPELPDVPPGEDDPITLPEWFACGKATEVIERIEAISRAAWNNRTTPAAMKSAIMAANPGYSVSMVWVLNLYTVGLGLSALEALGDADIFNSEFLKDWKCWLLNRLNNDAQGLDSGTWQGMQSWLIAYPLENEVPDLDVVLGIYVMNWYLAILDVLSRERFNQIMLEGAATQQDCSDCGGIYDTGYGGGETPPLASGYYLSANLAGSAGEILNTDAGWSQLGMFDTAERKIYGVLCQLNVGGPFCTIKRMEWDPAYMGLPVDVSIWGDTSGKLAEEGIHIGIPMITFPDITIAAQLAAQLNYSQAILKGIGVLGTELAVAAQTVGAELDFGDDTFSWSFKEFRWIYKSGSE